MSYKVSAYELSTLYIKRLIFNAVGHGGESGVAAVCTASWIEVVRCSTALSISCIIFSRGLGRIFVSRT